MGWVFLKKGRNEYVKEDTTEREGMPERTQLGVTGEERTSE